MPPVPFTSSATGLDLSPRLVFTTTVVASPAAAAETIIAQTVAVGGGLATASGILLEGWAAYTVGTAGTAVQFRLRQTNVTGTIVGNTGAMTGSQHGAGILSADSVMGVDTAPTAAGQVYVLTMQVTAATAASTVSAVVLFATVI